MATIVAVAPRPLTVVFVFTGEVTSSVGSFDGDNEDIPDGDEEEEVVVLESFRSLDRDWDTILFPTR